MITHRILHIPVIMAVAAAVAAVSFSCTKEETNNTINSQEESISKYLSSTFKNYEIIPREGSNRVIIDEGYGADSLSFGDSLIFYYAGYVFNNGPSQLFATNVRSVAEKSGFNITPLEHTYDEYSLIFESDSFVSGLTNGLYGVREGEHSVILFSARYGFYNKPVANVPSLSALMYEVWIEHVKKNL